MATVRTINHYDSLGITPKATQNEIKAAYYKLSMVYHPDKNKDEASLQKFRAITEAYEVLGNVKTRKMYDRGKQIINFYMHFIFTAFTSYQAILLKNVSISVVKNYVILVDCSKSR